jgi:ATP-dependent RNA helicase RhlE
LTDFVQLGLAAPLLKALATEGYTTPTPIQSQAIPHVLAGRDLLGIAQTGTGKTAAFALPILQRLAAAPRPTKPGTCRALILSPTRELASQIGESFRAYGRHMGMSVTVVFGGVSHGPQTQALRRGVDILVATPGRLLDHIGQRTTRLDAVEVLVLDEADHMLDLGFIHAIRKLVPMLPQKRQSLFFSATMPKEIGELASALLTDPVRVQVTPVGTTVERVAQRVILVEAGAKRALLAQLLRDPGFARTLVFTRTKHGADRVVQHLERNGIPAAAIHGNKSQGQRERALAGFKSGHNRILVATDIAARGIDVDDVSHVINFDLPNVAESYVHRIGRTARAGAEGIAISFCAPEERAYLRDIEKLVRRQLPAERHGNVSEPRPQQPARGERQPKQHQPKQHQPVRADRHPAPQRKRRHPQAQQRSHGGGGGGSLAAMPFLQARSGR